MNLTDAEKIKLFDEYTNGITQIQKNPAHIFKVYNSINLLLNFMIKFLIWVIQKVLKIVNVFILKIKLNKIK